MSTESNLYSPDLNIRYEASIHEPPSRVEAPSGFGGALNGWLMLVGPSRGKPAADV